MQSEVYLPMISLSFSVRKPMSEKARAEWLQATSDSLREKFRFKYINGALEHKSDLGEVPILKLLEELEAEALDQLAYVREIKRRINPKVHYEQRTSTSK